MEDTGFAALIGALLGRTEPQKQQSQPATPPQKAAGPIVPQAAGTPTPQDTAPKTAGVPLSPEATVTLDVARQRPSSVLAGATGKAETSALAPLLPAAAAAADPQTDRQIPASITPLSPSPGEAAAAPAPNRAVKGPAIPAEILSSPRPSAAAESAPGPQALANAAATPPSTPAPPASPAAQVAREVAFMHRQGLDQVRFVLEPAELGRVSIVLRRSEVRTEVRISVERPAALEALRPHLSSLGNALGDQASGQTADRDVRLSLSTDDGRGQQQGRDEAAQHDQRRSRDDNAARQDSPPRPAPGPDDDLIL